MNQVALLEKYRLRTPSPPRGRSILMDFSPLIHVIQAQKSCVVHTPLPPALFSPLPPTDEGVPLRLPRALPPQRFLMALLPLH